MNRRAFCLCLMLIVAVAGWYGSSWALSSGSASPQCPSTSCPAAHPALRHLMDGFKRPSTIPFPEDDPFSPAKKTLGESLFFDPLLSGSKTMSCATCHNPGLSWGDGLARAIGDTGKTLALRSPVTLDLAGIDVLGWDGKFPSLEAVAFAPITSADNMGLDEATAIRRLSAIAAYGKAFDAAFGDPTVTRPRIEQALATYERTIVSAPAPFDRWIDGDTQAIDAAAIRGFALFTGKAGCSACHSGWAFTDGSFHDIGSATGNDRGRGARFPTSVKLQYAFKVPTLRDAARRAPYMHDGSIKTLQAVIDLYDRGGIDRPSRSPKIKPLHLTDAEKSDLIAFIGTLTSDNVPVPIRPLPR